MTPDEIKNIFAAHAQWLADPTTGQRADLTAAYLSGADLTAAYLTGADLTGAILTHANLTRAIIVPGWRLVRV